MRVSEKIAPPFTLYKYRTWIWDEFKDGLIGSIAQESDAHNLKDEYVIDFSAKLNLDSKEILLLI